MCYLFVGIIIGIILNYIFGANKIGGDPVIGKNFKFKRDEKGNCIHIHHWMYLLPIVVLLFNCNIQNDYYELFMGFLLGLIVYDLSYRDFLEVNVKC